MKTDFDSILSAQSEMERQAISERLRTLPSVAVYLQELERVLAGEDENHREAATIAWIDNLLQTISRNEEMVNNTFQEKSREIRDEFIVSNSTVEKLAASLKYFQLHKQKLVEFYNKPVDDKAVLCLQVLLEWNTMALFEEIAEGFPEEQRCLAVLVVQAIFQCVEVKAAQMMQEKGKAPTPAERQVIYQGILKQLPAIIDQLATSEFEDYVDSEFDFPEDHSEGPGRPLKYEDSTDNYQTRWKTKHGKRPATSYNIERDLIEAVMKDESASPDEYPAYRAGILRALRRRIANSRSAKKTTENRQK